jgi:hypothetical protein
MPAGMSSAPLRRLHGPQSNWMFATVLAPPLLHGMTWSKCRSVVKPHWRHRPPSLAETAILTSWGMDLVFRSPTGAWTSGSQNLQPGGAWGRTGQAASPAAATSRARALATQEAD